MLAAFLFVLGSQRVPRPESSHPEWGPAPPVAPFGEAALPSQWIAVPMIFPIVGPNRYQNSYGEERGGYKHTGIDIGAPKMTPIVASFSGTLGFKKESYWIYGDDGYAILGTHLNDDNFGKSDHKADRDLMFAPGLVPGQHVKQGQFIGYVGMSGKATAPHLHFELYAPGRGPSQTRIRCAYPSLKHAIIISRPVPTPVDAKDIPKAGEEKWEGCVRKIEPESMSITLLLLSQQKFKGNPTVCIYPTWRKVRISPSLLESCGGWRSMRLRPSHIFAFHVTGTRQPIATLTGLEGRSITMAEPTIALTRR